LKEALDSDPKKSQMLQELGVQCDQWKARALQAEESKTQTELQLAESEQRIDAEKRRFVDLRQEVTALKWKLIQEHRRADKSESELIQFQQNEVSVTLKRSGAAAPALEARVSSSALHAALAPRRTKTSILSPSAPNPSAPKRPISSPARPSRKSRS